MIFSLIFFFIITAASFYFLYLIYKKTGFESIYFFYYSTFSFFFILRSFFLLTDMDTPFPPNVTIGKITATDYFLGLSGFFIWSFTFLILVLNIKNKKSGNGESSSESILKLPILIGVIISILYFTLAIVNAGSLSNIIYYLRINSEFEYGFMSSIPAVTLMLVSASYAIYGGNINKISIIGLLVCLQVITGDRSGIIFSIVIFIVVRFSLNKLSLFKFIAYIPFVFLTAFALKLYRSVFQLSINADDSNLARSVSSSLNLNIYDAYYSIVNYIGSGLEYRLGYDFYLGFVGLVPRFLWEGKPEVINTGVWFAQLYSDRKMGTPISSLGEWFLNFSYIGFSLGAIVTFFFLKMFLKLLPKNSEIKIALSLIFVLQVVQSGFTNVTIRESIIFISLVIVPMTISKFSIRSNK
jgi:oligosaccharide repeat unit polymerase